MIWGERRAVNEVCVGGLELGCLWGNEGGEDVGQAGIRHAECFSGGVIVI